MIHRLDAELTVGTRTPLDCRLAADGIDEALRIMRGHEPDPDLHARPRLGPGDDRDRRCHARLDGDPGAHHRHLERRGDRRAALPRQRRTRPAATAEISGSAADIDCWLWNRPAEGEIIRDGDAAALASVDAVLSDSID